MSYIRYVLFVFTSSCLQEGSCLIYVMFCCLYLQLFVEGLMSYLRYVLFVFTSSCLQEGCVLFTLCSVRLYLQLFVGGLVSYYTLCSVRLYLQLFVGGLMSYLRYVLFVFTSSCLQEGSCLIYVIFCSSLPPVVCRRARVFYTLCFVRLYLQLFVGGLSVLYTLCSVRQLFVRLMSYIRYVLLSLPSVVCRRAHVIYVMFLYLCLYLQLLVGGVMYYIRYVLFVFTSRCLYEGTCLIYVMFCSSLPPVVCRRAHVLFTLCSVRLYLQLFVGGFMSYLRYVLFVFTSSCLQEGSCLIYVMFGSSLPPVVCERAHVLYSLFSVRLYLQLFVGGVMSYLRYVLFVFTSSCLQEGSCLIYVMYGSPLPPVVCRRAHVLYTLCSVRLYLQLLVGGLMSYLRYALFVFTSSCLQEGSCLIYVMFCSSLPPVACRRARVLFTLCSVRL